MVDLKKNLVAQKINNMMNKNQIAWKTVITTILELALVIHQKEEEMVLHLQNNFKIFSLMLARRRLLHSKQLQRQRIPLPLLAKDQTPRSG